MGDSWGNQNLNNAAASATNPNLRQSQQSLVKNQQNSHAMINVDSQPMDNIVPSSSVMNPWSNLTNSAVEHNEVMDIQILDDDAGNSYRPSQ